MTYWSRMPLISFGAGSLCALLGLGFLHLLTDDVIAQVDALVADENGGPGDQLANFMLAFAAKEQ